MPHVYIYIIIAKGSCDWPIELTTKAFSNGLKKQEENSTSIAITPAYKFLNNFRVSTEQVNKILLDWRWNTSDGGHPSNIRAREVVCNWVKELDLNEYIPSGYPKMLNTVDLPTGFVVINVLNYIGIVVSSLIAILLWTKRKEFKASQPEFLVIALFGAICFFIYGILRTSAPTTTSCIAQIWFANFGWGLFLVTLVLKELRVRELYRAAMKFKKPRMTIKNVRQLLLAWMFIVEFLITLIWTLVHPPEAIFTYIQSENDSNTLLKYEICSMQNYESIGWMTLSVILNGSVIILGVIMALQTRNIDSRFSESKVIAAIMYNTFVISLFIGIYILESGRVSQYPHRIIVVESLGIFIGTTLNVMLLYIPKMLKLEKPLEHLLTPVREKKYLPSETTSTIEMTNN